MWYVRDVLYRCSVTNSYPPFFEISLFFRPNTRWRDGVTFIVTFHTDKAAVEITVFMRT